MARFGKTLWQRATGIFAARTGPLSRPEWRELLDYMGLLKRLYDRHSHRNQMASLLDMVGLTQVADRKIKTYSGGMKRRLGIAQALLALSPYFPLTCSPSPCIL
ncbi:MAG: ATP-binding cassette domain-containing protein [Ktedonobacteraceae bacterium]